MKQKLLYALAVPLALLLCACASTEIVQKEKPNSGVEGQVFIQNKGAVGNVYVYAYDSPYNDMRVPTKLISKPTAPDGTYTLNLTPGTYFIVARKRTSGSPKGYLVKGDYEGKYPANPVVVKPGKYEKVNVSISRLDGNFLLAPYIPSNGDKGVRGKVYDESGKPARGAYVMVYDDPDMVGLPKYLSKATDGSGSYFVYVPKPGNYYVAARLKYGGIPKKGEPYGTYDKNKEHMITLNGNEVISGIDVKLGPFPFNLTEPMPPAHDSAPSMPEQGTPAPASNPAH
ncbi:MAG: carboxypeptidase-like regulatory domain-containing protein [Nitrospirota bacterium]